MKSCLMLFFEFYNKLFQMRGFCSSYLTSVSYKKILKLSDKRLKLDLFDYEQIAKPLKKYRTNEIWYYNEVYGLSHIFKKYTGYKDSYKLKFIAMHGVKHKNYNGPGYSWEFTQNAPLIFATSNFAKENIERFVEKTVKVISGSVQILYTDKYYNNEQFDERKAMLGKNLLVFPAHSMTTKVSLYNISSFINEIKKVKKKYDFDSVTICLFWRDIKRSIDKQYLGHGFNITCAGHTKDCNFFPRLRTIIELSDVTMANSDTSAMWYSLSLGKPFFLCHDNSLTYKNFNYIGDPEFDAGWYERHKENESVSEIYDTFAEYTDYITEKQKILIDKYCDIKNFKSPKEMQDIFYESEQMYKTGKYRSFIHSFISDEDV